MLCSQGGGVHINGGNVNFQGVNIYSNQASVRVLAL